MIYGYADDIQCYALMIYHLRWMIYRLTAGNCGEHVCDEKNKNPERRIAFRGFVSYKIQLEFNLFLNVLDCFFHAHADLFHGVAVADGYGVVFQGLEVNGYAERRTDFVLTAVTLTD